MPRHIAPHPTPVRNAQEAEDVLRLALPRPLEHETLAFLLDTDGTGGLMICIEGTEPLESVLLVTDMMSTIAARLPEPHGLVVATVRPRVGVVPGDIDRWLAASDIAADHGVRLLEWYVVDHHGFHCPRELIGEPMRWAHWGQ
jgi:hypothetical protein